MGAASATRVGTATAAVSAKAGFLDQLVHFVTAIRARATTASTETGAATVRTVGRPPAATVAPVIFMEIVAAPAIAEEAPAMMGYPVREPVLTARRVFLGMDVINVNPIAMALPANCAPASTVIATKASPALAYATVTRVGRCPAAAVAKQGIMDRSVSRALRTPP